MNVITIGVRKSMRLSLSVWGCISLWLDVKVRIRKTMLHSYLQQHLCIDITLDIPISRYLNPMSSKIRKIRARSVINNGIFYNILMPNHGCKKLGEDNICSWLRGIHIFIARVRPVSCAYCLGVSNCPFDLNKRVSLLGVLTVSTQYLPFIPQFYQVTVLGYYLINYL